MTLFLLYFNSSEILSVTSKYFQRSLYFSKFAVIRNCNSHMLLAVPQSCIVKYTTMKMRAQSYQLHFSRFVFRNMSFFHFCTISSGLFTISEPCGFNLPFCLQASNVFFLFVTLIFSSLLLMCQQAKIYLIISMTSTVAGCYQAYQSLLKNEGLNVLIL